MNVGIESSGNFDNITRWLTQATNKPPTKTLNQIGKEGVSALKGATPRGETGETAAGWDYRVEQIPEGAEVAYVNNAHPESSANVAKLIQYGHGTGTGGYVPPRDYINPALRATFNNSGDRLAKEMFT